jgi:hypothetical protein
MARYHIDMVGGARDGCAAAGEVVGVRELALRSYVTQRDCFSPPRPCARPSKTKQNA